MRRRSLDEWLEEVVSVHGMVTDDESILWNARAHLLLARYCWALDADPSAEPDLSGVFTADVVADYEGFSCRGHVDLARRLQALHRELRSTQHLTGSVLAGPDGAGGGVATSHVRATLVGREGRRLEVAASYRDWMTETSTGWRVSRREVRGLWMDGDRTILPWMKA